MEPREFNNQIFAQFARIGSALGHAKRVEIVNMLMQGERTVEALSQQVSASVANTSRHLQILAAAGLVTRRVEGTSRVYRLAGETVAAAYLALVEVAEAHLAEITALAEGVFSGIDGATPVSFDELDQLRRAGETVIVDVRPSPEFAAGHIEGAINIPLAELDARMTELPADRNVVAYCRGTYCVMAAHAAALLRAQGHSARRLEGGLPEWRIAGRPVTECTLTDRPRTV